MPDVRMPDGTIIRNVPEGTTRAQLQEKIAQSKKPTSFLQGVAEGALPAVTNIAKAMQYVNPFLVGTKAASRVMGTPDVYSEKVKAGNAKVKGALSRTGYRGSTVGKITGGIIGTLPTLALPGGAFAQGAAGGALLNEDGTVGGILRDAAVGGVAGKVGDVVGKRVVAPVAERIGRTAPARAVANRVTNAVNSALGSNAIKSLPLPKFTKTDKAMGRVSPELSAVRQNLDDAARLGMPYSLADAAPELRMLGGSVARKSASARALAENTFGPRNLGQADRAVNAIDTHLAPITNIEQRAAQIKKQAWDAADPLYQDAFSQPAPIDADLQNILRRPAGKSALANAYEIAQNSGRNPSELGFVLDDAGQPTLADLIGNEASRYANVKLGNPADELTRTTVRGMNRDVSKVGPTDLVGFIRLNGGLMDQGGELSHMGLNNAARRGMDFVGQEQRFGPLVHDGGMNLDDAAFKAWEAGYFPDLPERPSVNQFLDALRGTHEGWDRRFLPDDIPQIERFGNAVDEANAAREVRFETGRVPLVDRSVSAAGDVPFAPPEAYEMSTRAVNSPTMETLDLVKRGLDQELEPFRNPITRQLNLEGNPKGKAVNDLLQDFRARVDTLNPDYAAARAAYADGIAPRTALKAGYEVLPKGNVPMREFEASLAAMPEAGIPEAQRGYATAMANAVERQRLSSNPYNTVYGSPLQQQKVGALFPDGANDFGRVYGLEGDMAKTAYETIGGSPTAARQQADEIFGNGDVTANALQAITSPKLGLLQLGARKVSDHMRTRGERNAAEMAPVLFNTDPRLALQYLDDLAGKNADMAVRKDAYRRLGGIFGVPAGVGSVALLPQN